jgi:hypothetical protein
MAAPERFAEMADSSCNASVVHTWHTPNIRAVRRNRVLNLGVQLTR